jgi:HEPN domain-containing protein
MRNQKLAEDYISRAEKRIEALKTLMKVEAWADVVRESQECVELALKSLLRVSGIEVPRVHDVSEILVDQKARLPKRISKHLERFIEISRRMRRDRELAFYGTEDLTPSEFYKETDAKKALEDTVFIVKTVKPHI